MTPSEPTPRDLQPLSGPAAWHGRDLAASEAWVRDLPAGMADALDAALRHANAAQMPTTSIRRQDFPLPGFDEFFQAVQAELEDGLGLIRLRGLPVDRWSEADLKRVWWGFGLHLGTPVPQSSRAEWIGEVRDESRDAPTVDYSRNQVLASRARARSTGPLRFHTDLCDVIGLLCARNGIAGGVSKLASTVTIYNTMLARRPELAAALFEDAWRSRPEEQEGLHADRAFALPVWAIHRGKFSSQYSRTYVEQAQEFAEVPRITDAQVAAMDMLAEVAEEVCMHSAFEPGDMQFLNNHVVYHGRTAYDDDAAGGKTRLLLRLWLSMPNSRALPEGFEVVWQNIEAGALRGGAPQRTPQPAVA